MEELSDNQVRAKLSDALGALGRAREATRTRPLMTQLKTALTRAIESFDTPPAPSPVPGDLEGGRGGG